MEHTLLQPGFIFERDLKYINSDEIILEHNSKYGLYNMNRDKFIKLLKHLRDNLHNYMTNDLYCKGICQGIHIMSKELNLNYWERHYINDNLISFYPPFNSEIVIEYGQYRWIPGQIEPRVKFLDSVISKFITC